MKRRALTASVILHGIVIFFALTASNNFMDDENVEITGVDLIQDPLKDFKIEEKSNSSPDEEYKEVEKGIGLPESKKESDCKDWYGGIGIMANGFLDIEQTITAVYSNYPADKMGLKVGDVIETTEDIRGQVGSPVTLTVHRDGQIFKTTLIREKICGDIK